MLVGVLALLVLSVIYISKNNILKQEQIDLFGTSEKIEGIRTESIEKTNEEVVRKENTDRITYIYEAEDLCNFRDKVNSGETYEGREVYLMEDIDLSSVCSKEVGTFEPIGKGVVNFEGTFNGKYHAIRNVYINSEEYQNVGLFSILGKKGKIENLILEDVEINNGYNSETATSRTGGIVGYSEGEIVNSGIESGRIVGKRTTKMNDIYGTYVGGIIGNGSGKIRGSYNRAEIEAYNTYENEYTEVYTGGIAGYYIDGEITNSYNTGNIKGNGYNYSAVGGIVGRINNTRTRETIIKNTYNVGEVIGETGRTKHVGGVVGNSGWSSTNYSGEIENSYCTNRISYSYYNAESSSIVTTTEGKITEEEMKENEETLGTAYQTDTTQMNGGYPILYWQMPQIELNIKQENIKVGEEKELEVSKTLDIQEILQEPFTNKDCVWTSSNEDVAKVNGEGKVIGIGVGYTTITATNEQTGLKAKGIINVRKDERGVIAVEQAESGEGFTAILREDGTVWTVGKNNVGQLGNGTKENSNVAVQVKIEGGKNLTEIIKISVGKNFVVALKRDGTIWTWGDNNKGQLGNGKIGGNREYAEKVVGEKGIGSLGEIIDISAGYEVVGVVNKEGEVYTFGKRTEGIVGDGIEYSTNTGIPQKSNMQNVIKVSVKEHILALTVTGKVYGWGGKNIGGEAVCLSNNPLRAKRITENANDIIALGKDSIILKEDGNIYGCGINEEGELQTGDKNKVTSLVKLEKLPEVVKNGSEKIKYISGGEGNINLLLTDGTVWTNGSNNKGTCGNGKIEDTIEFVQAKEENNNKENNNSNQEVNDDNQEVNNNNQAENSAENQAKNEEGIDNEVIQNALLLGRHTSWIEKGKYGLNTQVIKEDGSVWIAGDNTNGQYGNKTNISNTYFNKMGALSTTYDNIRVYTGEEYTINRNKLINNYIKVASPYEIGKLKFSSKDETIVEVDEEGRIEVQVKENEVKQTIIEIEDITNGYKIEIPVITNRLNNTNKIEYIYTVEDLCNFRDKVNEGETYEGKEVYVMNDIDLSSVCSEKIGSFDAIGSKVSGFEFDFTGTFNGNYHTISNLYISDKRENTGLFRKLAEKGIIENLILENVYVYNDLDNFNWPTNTRAGALVGLSKGTIKNCQIKSGLVKQYRSDNNGNKAAYMSTGGIVGINNGGIYQCHNNATVEAYDIYNISSNIYEAKAGGIAGQNGTGKIKDCYNTGRIFAKAGTVYAGGIVGTQHLSDSNNPPSTQNSYNIGEVSTVSNRSGDKYTAGILNMINGKSPVINSYCLNNTTYSIEYWNGKREPSTSENVLPASTLKTYENVLGQSFQADKTKINNGYPILYWQAPQISLNERQTYIKIGEEKKLKINKEVDLQKILPDNIRNVDFSWESSNEDVAKVDGYGKVTGIGVGYTTITATHIKSGLKAKAIINVVRNGKGAITVPQVESGEGYTAILKEDGTVWTVGKNNVGQLGNGTTQNRNVPVQVKIDKYTNLTDVIKISANPLGMVALKKDGTVWTWGNNQSGRLGNNNLNVTYREYAEKVVGLEGKGYLKNVIDISTGAGTVVALDKKGNVYIWGMITGGVLGDGINREDWTVTPVPLTSSIRDAIKISSKRNTISLIQTGEVYAWGESISMTLMGNGYVPNRIATDAIDIAIAGKDSIILKEDGKLYGCGENEAGELQTGNRNEVRKLVKIANVPSQVKNKIAKIKYISGGQVDIQLVLSDGTVWINGKNDEGILGNGTKTDSVEFVQMKTNNRVITNALLPGRNARGIETRYGMNSQIIREDGSIWITGNNTYGQFGNETNVPSTYLTKMGTEFLNLKNKRLEIKVNESKTIDNKEIILGQEFNVFTEYEGNKEIELTYKSEKENIVNVDNNGVITGVQKGIGKIKVTDKITELSTEIWVKVVEEDIGKIEAGNNFTVTLKTNKTVWTFGDNEKGQLGVGDEKNREDPSKVITEKGTLEKIIDIGAGYNHAIAVNEEGEVYVWGDNEKGQLGLSNTSLKNKDSEDATVNESYSNEETSDDENTEEKITKVNKATKVEGLENIEKVDAYKNMSIALNKEGEVYVWGEGYSKTPQKLELKNKVIEISGNIILTENREVCTLDESKSYLKDIISISAGENHYLALNSKGEVYAWGNNKYGQLGNGNNETAEEPVRVLGEEGIGKSEDIYEISAGANYSLIMDIYQNVYSFGLNETYKLGYTYTSSSVNVPKLIESMSDTVVKISTAEDLKRFSELVSAGKTYEGRTIGLTDNIDLSSVCSSTKGNWKAIGTNEHPFKGTFDGQGYSVSGIYINTEENNQGLFGYVSNATIKNITLKTGNIVGGSRVGGLVGYAIDSTIDNIVNEGTIVKARKESVKKGINYNDYSRYLTQSGNYPHTEYSSNGLGGICGEAENTSIQNCINKIDIKQEEQINVSIGGIVGDIYGGKGGINNCINYGKITLTKYISGNIGGIAGTTFGKVKTKKCENNGIIYDNTKEIIYEANQGIGGIIGSLAEEAAIENCKNNANITGRCNIGGIAGYTFLNKSLSSRNTIRNCINIGNITSTINILYNCKTSSDARISIISSASVGGIVGYGNGTNIELSYNTGRINGNGGGQGGIVGLLSFGYIYNCYNTGKIGSLNNNICLVGGIAGTMQENVTIRYCYNKGEIYGNNAIGGISGASRK